MEEYDVFLSHNSKDRPIVEKFATVLSNFSLKVWLDDAAIRPGTPTQPSIERGLLQSKSVAVFIGPNSTGQWQEREVQVAISLQVKHQIPVIPIFLPGLSDTSISSITPFLGTNRWIDFRMGVEDQKALFDLRWGITGNRPELTEPEPARVEVSDRPASRSPVDESIAYLVKSLQSQNVTYFLGPGASHSNPPARSCDIARELLSDLRIIEKNYEQLLPPMDVAGMYYSIESSDQGLEDRVVEIINTPREVPAVQERLASLLQLLAKRPPRRRRSQSQQLIISSNLDLITERAFLRAGLSFTRVVQHRSAERIDVNEYRDVQLMENNQVQLRAQSEREPPEQISLDDPEALDSIIQTYGARTYRADENTGTGENPLHKLPLQEFTEPILYKLLGSQDISNSCVLSTTHHFTFASNVLKRNSIPAQVTEIIGNSPSLFIGVSFLDPDFRLMNYVLLRNALNVAGHKRYALQLSPDCYVGDIYRRMETGLWDALKDFGAQQLGVKSIEEPSDVFLQKLIDGLSRVPE